MPWTSLPEWMQDWALYVGWPHAALAVAGGILVTLLIIWWRQQTRVWFRIVVGAFLVALLLTIGSYYLFVVPAYYAGCPQGCPGWRGFPLRFAEITVGGANRIGALDFLLNLMMLWLMWLGAGLVWRLLGGAVQWGNRSWRGRLLFILALAVLPWALLPRVIDPPQPAPQDDDLRLAVNAQRSAEFTYRITGPWVQRLALEDIRHAATAAETGPAFSSTEFNEVCLRGYTYFYLPWRRYRITLDTSGVTALRLVERPLTGSCWE